MTLETFRKRVTYEGTQGVVFQGILLKTPACIALVWYKIFHFTTENLCIDILGLNRSCNKLFKT